MNPIIFLDIDGVLNDHQFNPEVLCGQILPAKVAILNRVLRATDARIVLSSAWRYIVHRGESNLVGMEWLLRSHGVIAGRLIGITREDTMERGIYLGEPSSWPLTNERGQQINDWLMMERGDETVNCGLRYVVIDDLDLGITEASHPFVQTDKDYGITESDADRAIEILRGVGAKRTVPLEPITETQ